LWLLVGVEADTDTKLETLMMVVAAVAVLVVIARERVYQ